jgi:hypothetical protein
MSLDPWLSRLVAFDQRPGISPDDLWKLDGKALIPVEHGKIVLETWSISIGLLLVKLNTTTLASGIRSSTSHGRP